MRIVTPKELSSFKILPFDLYNEVNQKILAAGEVLTPGKLIMLKNYTKIFTEEVYSDDSSDYDDSSQKAAEKKTSLKKLANFSFDSIDITDFETVINKENVLNSDVQIKIKYFMRKTLDLLMEGYFREGLVKLNQLTSIMMTDIFKQLFRSKKGSQIRFLGEYEICHPLNVAIVAGMIAKRLDYTNAAIEQVVIASLIHDIGKFKMHIEDESPLLTTHEAIIAEHTVLGYELIKNELGMDEQIAKVALEHHENNDGSGYPKGLSSDYISEWAQIVNVANYYDNLACNRTTFHVSNNRDVLRAMLEVGTKRFSARMLYTFVHMFNYDDPMEFNDMVF